MSFNDLILTLEKDDNAFNDLYNRCSIFLESSEREYKTNLKEAELKVAQESGSVEDLIYLKEAAGEGFIERTGKAIKKIIDTLVDWIEKTANAIKDFFSSKTTKETLDKANAIANENPKLKKTTVEVQDYEATEKVCAQYEAKVDKKLALFKANKFSEKDEDELDKIQIDFEKDLKEAQSKKKVVTIGAVLGILGAGVGVATVLLKKKDEVNKIKGEVDKQYDWVKKMHHVNNDTPPKKGKTNLNKFKKEVEDQYADIKKMYNIESNPEDMKVHVKGFKLKSDIVSKSVNCAKDKCTGLLKSLKTLFTKSSEVPTDNVTESTNINEIGVDNYLDNLLEEINESVDNTMNNNFDPESYLDIMESVLIDTDDEVTESFDADEYLDAMESVLLDSEDDGTVTAEEYLDAMEAELFDDDDFDANMYLNAMESALFE